jgi:hypothetical protein
VHREDLFCIQQGKAKMRFFASSLNLDSKFIKPFQFEALNIVSYAARRC